MTVTTARQRWHGAEPGGGAMGATEGWHVGHRVGDRLAQTTGWHRAGDGSGSANNTLFKWY
ncbi:hypothetical protein E2562_013594 [Oryza meyeriana var. granulata]|uniref:Uncharacterized protein n=1 Tax=Oryza meyeriana var. granulata TaxID=110450 RepID=A0A6G1C4V6_9ORYZ|nr:hypothetical protein E2562_013594 [Oryza meyeriana var. granulata]